MRRAALAALAGALVGCGGDGEGAGEPITVSAASSLTEALTDYAKPFEARLSFAGSDELAAQIRRGVRPDVFASADAELPQELFEEGLVEEPEVFATNELVVAVPAKTEVGSVEDLAKPGIRIAIGAATVPVGDYAAPVVKALGAARNVRTREPSVTGILAKLRAGAVDAGLVYKTDVVANAGALRSIRLPERLQPRIEYAAAVVKGSERHDEAARFLTGLQGAPELIAAGFGPP